MFGSIKQRTDESTGDFYKRFLAELQAYKSCGGSFVVVPKIIFDLVDEDKRVVIQQAMDAEADSILAIKFLGKLDKFRSGIELKR